MGVVSIGVVSIGVVSIGVVSIGIIFAGVFRPGRIRACITPKSHYSEYQCHYQYSRKKTVAFHLFVSSLYKNGMCTAFPSCRSAALYSGPDAGHNSAAIIFLTAFSAIRESRAHVSK
ncbi:MAG: hypothetical protein LBB83_06030 [Treponema sp.]|nr:hypothetical protein [Treponema sp.]